MLGMAVVVWLWVVVLICVRDNSLVVGGLCPRHPIPGGLRFRAVPRWVRSLRRETGSNICAVAAPIPGPGRACHCRGPGGIILTASDLVGGMLVGYVVHLLLTAVVPTGV
jgi:hypothetical protein